MATPLVYKCKMCGGDLDVMGGQAEDDIVVCPYCGSRQTLPTPFWEQEMDNSRTGVSVDSLLRRIQLFLEDGSWDDALQYCDKVLDIDPENPQAYLGKVMAQAQVKTIQGVVKHENPLSENPDFQKAIRFSSGDEKQRLLKLEAGWQPETKYQNAKNFISEGGKENLQKAVDILRDISDYKDANELYVESKKSLEKLLEEENNTFGCLVLLVIAYLIYKAFAG